MRFNAEIDMSKLTDVLKIQGTDPEAENVKMRIDMWVAQSEDTKLVNMIYDAIEDAKDDELFDEANDFEEGNFTIYTIPGVKELAVEKYQYAIVYVSFPLENTKVRLHPHDSEAEIWGPTYNDQAEEKTIRKTFDILVKSGLVKPKKNWKETYTEAIESFIAEETREITRLEKEIEKKRRDLANAELRHTLLEGPHRRKVFWLPPIKEHLPDKKIIEEVEKLEDANSELAEIETGGTIIRDTGDDDGRWEVLYISHRGYVWKDRK